MTELSLSGADVERIAEAVARRLGNGGTVTYRTIKNIYGRTLDVALEGEGDHQLNPGTAGDD